MIIRKTIWVSKTGYNQIFNSPALIPSSHHVFESNTMVQQARSMGLEVEDLIPVMITYEAKDL